MPVADNYFLHQMLTGSYPQHGLAGLPPYLSGGADAPLAGGEECLLLVDGSYLDYLESLPDASVNGFALSNICEWLEPAEVDRLMAEVVRTAAPGARLVFRNFVGWTEVPDRWNEIIVDDRAAGERLIARDRSLMQRRIATCRILDEEPATSVRESPAAREAVPGDNPALLELAAGRTTGREPAASTAAVRSPDGVRPRPRRPRRESGRQHRAH